MSGSLPFGEDSTEVMDIYESIILDDVNLKKIRNRGEKPLIQALLEKDPAKRLKSCL